MKRIILGLVLGFIAGYLLSSSSESEDKPKNKTKPKRKVPTKKDTDKIMKLFTSKNRVVNDDVEKLLKVSDKTAERYLNRLVEEDLVVRHGKTKGTYYTRR